MKNDHDEQQDSNQPRPEKGSGHYADSASETPDIDPIARSKPEHGDLERMANDVRHTQRQHQHGEDEPLEGELVQREIVREEVTKIMTSIWSGPTPSPETLEAFNKVDPTFANRAFTMSEETVRASNLERTTLAQGDVDAVKRGQWMAWTASIVGMLGAAGLALTGHEVVALPFLAPPIFQFFGTFIRTIRTPAQKVDTEPEPKELD